MALINARGGFILVVLILSLFLRLRLALWVSLGVPLSFLGALLLLPSMDVSINLLKDVEGGLTWPKGGGANPQDDFVPLQSGEYTVTFHLEADHRPQGKNTVFPDRVGDPPRNALFFIVPLLLTTTSPPSNLSRPRTAPWAF